MVRSSWAARSLASRFSSFADVTVFVGVAFTTAGFGFAPNARATGCRCEQPLERMRRAQTTPISTCPDFITASRKCRIVVESPCEIKRSLPPETPTRTSFFVALGSVFLHIERP